MTFTDKHIVETYSNLFEGLSSQSKLELIENLSKSLKVEKNQKKILFINLSERLHLPKQQR